MSGVRATGHSILVGSRVRPYGLALLPGQARLRGARGAHILAEDQRSKDHGRPLFLLWSIRDSQGVEESPVFLVRFSALMQACMTVAEGVASAAEADSHSCRRGAGIVRLRALGVHALTTGFPHGSLTTASS